MSAISAATTSFVIFRSADWEMRCWQLIAGFGEAVANLLGVDERLRGGYMAENRRGELQLPALPALSIGAVRIGRAIANHIVKLQRLPPPKQAKKRAKNPASDSMGGGLFIERRSLSAVRRPCRDHAPAGFPHFAGLPSFPVRRPDGLMLRYKRSIVMKKGDADYAELGMS